MAMMVRLANRNRDRMSLKSLVSVTHFVAMVMMAVDIVRGSMVKFAVPRGKPGSFKVLKAFD